MRKTLSLITVLQYITILTSAQQAAPEAPLITLQGKIVNAANHEPIAFATISLSRDGLNTISNETGNFIFLISSAQSTDSIYISHVGYQSVGFALRTADTAEIVIALQERPIELPAVTVNRTDALGIIRNAIDRIPANYPTRPYLLTGFYRETVTNDHRFTNLSEAVFDIYSPDNERKNMELRLIKARAIRDLASYQGLSATFGKRPARLMDFDLVSRIHANQLPDEAGQNDHIFTLLGYIDYQGRTAYEISFDQKDDAARSLYKGRIIIDSASLAFLCFDYRLSPKGLKYRTPNDKGLHALMIGQSNFVTYRPFGGKYYLHHVLVTDSMVIHYQYKDATLDFNPLVAGVNYLVTRIDTSSAALKPAGKKVDDQTLIETHVQENSRRRNDYWENYNHVEANFNIDSALNAIARNNKAYTQSHH